MAQRLRKQLLCIYINVYLFCMYIYIQKKGQKWESLNFNENNNFNRFKLVKCIEIHIINDEYFVKYNFSSSEDEKESLYY